MSFSDSEKVWLAALLHDIGKFQQRAEWDSRIRHEEFGAKWCEQNYFTLAFGDDLAEGVRQHHNPNPNRSNADRLRLIQIVQLADRLAAGERAQETREQEDPQRSGLVSIFSRIPLNWIDGGEPSYPPEQRYPVQPLDWNSETLLPQTNPHIGQDAYKNLWEEFNREWQRLAANRTYTSADFRTIVALLEKYTSFVPSATPWENQDERTVPDVSLYDHLRVTAAIAACLDKQLIPNALEQAWRNPKEYNEPLLALVKGDLSGIQDFLYLTGRGGAARGLKGRSFFLQLLTEAIAQFILRKFELPIVCQLLASGGHFYLFIPYNSLEQLRRLREEISRKLFKAFQGDLRMLIEAVPLTTADFLGNFAGKWAELGQALNRSKQRLWAELPDNEFQQLFTPVQRATDAESLCQVCHGARQRGQGGVLGDDLRKGRRCHSFEELGTRLRTLPALHIEWIDPIDPPENADWEQTLGAFGWKIHLEGEAPVEPRFVKITFSPDFLPTRLQPNGSYEFRPLASVVPPPIEGNRLPDYEEIAERATGAQWLGVLRMDVDSLGQLFARGLGNEATVSRMATLSRTMRYFFEGYVAHLCEAYAQKQQIYLIYAGGDDLFIVGAWSVLPELAFKIRRAFRQLVGADHITLSAGIAINHPTAPLYQLAETARHALDEQAKTHLWQANGTQREKDAICFLQTPMGWGEFERVHAMFQQVCQMVQGEGDSQRGKVPRAFITRLAHIASLYQRNATHVRQLIRQGQVSANRKHDLTFYARWLWRSLYHLSRFAEQHKAWQHEIEQIRSLLVGNNSIIHHLHVVARWAELYTRGKEG